MYPLDHVPPKSIGERTGAQFDVDLSRALDSALIAYEGSRGIKRLYRYLRLRWLQRSIP